MSDGSGTEAEQITESVTNVLVGASHSVPSLSLSNHSLLSYLARVKHVCHVLRNVNPTGCEAGR